MGSTVYTNPMSGAQRNKLWKQNIGNSLFMLLGDTDTFIWILHVNYVTGVFQYLIIHYRLYFLVTDTKIFLKLPGKYS